MALRCADWRAEGSAVRELTTFGELIAFYGVYRACMYRPNRTRYLEKARNWRHCENVRVFACFERETPAGILVLRFQTVYTAEILGIAVTPSERNHGIATCMLRYAAEMLKLQTLTAETDADAAGFYRKTGFTTITQIKVYDGQPVTRYFCTWTKERSSA